MSHVFLEPQILHSYDERALDVLYHSIQRLRKKRLTRQEVISIYNRGITVVFTGNGLDLAPELNYALFLPKSGCACQ